MDADIIILDNDSTDPDTCNFLSQIGDDNRLRVIRVEGPFNFSRLNNIGVREARTEFVCLLNNDVKALDKDWLGEMLTRINEPDVGAVGALLIWPSGLIQHAGVVLGPSFAATHAFNDRLVDDSGYADLLRVAHECSAVTAACMLTRRSDYLNVGGLDEIRLPVSFNDVDYCLKLREAGKRIVFTPHAKLIHLESASRGKDLAPGPAARFGRELGVLRSRWHQYLIDDPYYSPMLSLDVVPFSSLAWPPRNMQARAQYRIKGRDLPPGF
jgi:O-antigen biosynthesis protein